MKYSVNEVKFITGLNERYVKVTFTSEVARNRVVLFDVETNEIYDYMIERTDLSYYKHLTSFELPVEYYYGKMSLYLLTKDDVKEFVSAYDEDELNGFTDLHEFYNTNKEDIIDIINELLLHCEFTID